jgi:hypothetical protein
MLQALKRRNCILEFGVINDGKTPISRHRPRYENNMKVHFLARGGDDVNWTRFKPDIKNYVRFRPQI